MSGASNILDPVELARDDISRSKHLIASTLDDLTQHHSWLEAYHRDERRRAQRLARQDALRRLERKRQRAMWHTRRFTAVAYAVTRAIVLILVETGAALVSWAAPRAQALALTASHQLSTGSRWSWRTGRSLARQGFDRTEQAFTWSVRASEAGGVVFRRRASRNFALLSAYAAVRAEPAMKRATIGWTRTRHRTRRFACTLETRLSHGWSNTQNAVSRWMEESPKLRRSLAREVTAGVARTRLRAKGLSRAALKTGSTSWSWAALRTRQVLAQRATVQQRALIVRPCTALVCVEPRRARLPSVLVT